MERPEFDELYEEFEEVYQEKRRKMKKAKCGGERRCRRGGRSTNIS